MGDHLDRVECKRVLRADRCGDSTPTADYEVANKKYVDDNAVAFDEYYDTKTKLIKLGTGTESVVKGTVRIPK